MAITFENWDRFNASNAPLEGMVRRFNGIGWCWVQPNSDMDKLFRVQTADILSRSTLSDEWYRENK